VYSGRVGSSLSALTCDPVSTNGRYVVFRSYARLTAQDPDEEPDLYVVDLDTGLASDVFVERRPGAMARASGNRTEG
jgi:hypothetical protein